ncbi:MAG: thiolase family protein [Planctomycetaceae bacterium]
MPHAVVVDAVRTPVGRASAENGCFRDVRAEDLAARVIAGLVERVRLEPALVEDVRFGCVQQQGEQGFDVARVAALVAGMPVETCGVTINRNCGSSLQAINDAAAAVAAGHESVVVAGGVEHMDHVPMNKGYDPCPSLLRRHGEGVMQMGLTAEYLALKYRIGRKRQDAFALRSHQAAAAATDSGLFAAEILPTLGRDAEGRRTEVREDQCIRRDTSLEALAALPPVFNPAGGSVTAGNASPTNVGAAALLVMSDARAAELGLEPLARIRAVAVAGVEPCEMGIGPVPAIHKALARGGVRLEDVGAIEINEAFAVQVLACLQLLSIDESRVNTRGGAIAIGHPLGASGARLATTLLHRMRADGIPLGLAAMCIGQGQGIATLFEAV